MTNFIKRLARLLFREYSFYHIYGCSGTSEITTSLVTGFRLVPVERNEIDSSEDELIVQQAWYFGDGSHAYACMDGSRIIALCFFWYGDRYQQRNFWPLADKEAKLVQLIVLPEMRGRGIASSLIKFATQDMSRRRFKYMYARIWWSNTPSLRAFEGAGWARMATVVEIYLFGRTKPLRLKLAACQT
jgi:GNAT superfamily N-acetyltransferase